MESVELVTSSSTGTLRLPEKVRKGMGIKSGMKFAVFNDGDMIIFKKIQLPTINDFEELVDWGVEFAKKKGITPEDVLKKERNEKLEILNLKGAFSDRESAQMREQIKEVRANWKE